MKSTPIQGIFAMTFLVMAFGVLAVASDNPDPIGRSDSSRPKVTIAKPSASEKVKKGDNINILTRIDVKEGQWSPSHIIVEILSAKNKTLNFGETAVIVKPPDASGMIEAKAKLRLPTKPGKYIIQVTASVDLPTKPAAGVSRKRKEVISTPVEIEVQ